MIGGKQPLSLVTEASPPLYMFVLQEIHHARGARKGSVLRCRSCARLLFLVDVARVAQRKKHTSVVAFCSCFVFRVEVEDVLQSLRSDIREAARGSVSRLRNRVVRDDEVTLER